MTAYYNSKLLTSFKLHLSISHVATTGFSGLLRWVGTYQGCLEAAVKTECIDLEVKKKTAAATPEKQQHTPTFTGENSCYDQTTSNC